MAAAAVQGNPARLAGSVTVEVAAQAAAVAHRQERMAGPDQLRDWRWRWWRRRAWLLRHKSAGRGFSPVVLAEPAVSRQAVAAAEEVVAASAPYLFGPINVTITDNITGGVGGAGGAGNGGAGGNGGSGGLGILFASTQAQAIISATVSGGDGGTSSGGTAGAGGDGLNLYSDTSILITGTGTVSGGLSGDGVRGNAMQFFGINSTLTLYSGATIVGDVKGVGGQTLRLSGLDDGTFDASTLGATAQLQVFSTLEKTDNTKWTLTGTSTYAGATEVQAGTMALDAAMASSSFTVSSGATLMGIGQTGALTLDTGAIHAPGN